MGVSHECDFPSAANGRPRVTHCPIHHAGLASSEVDAWVRGTLSENGTIYTIDEPLLRKLRPDLILTQKLCDVCAVGYGTVARMAATLPGPPTVVSLEPSSLADILENIRQVAEVCGVPERAETVVAQLSSRVEMVRQRVAQISHRPRCFLMEWVDPPFCAGNWGPELVEIAGGFDPLGRKHQKSVQIEWKQVLKARPEVIVLALCGYDALRGERDLDYFAPIPASTRSRRRGRTESMWWTQTPSSPDRVRGLSTASSYSPGFCIPKSSLSSGVISRRRRAGAPRSRVSSSA